jgi:hypothetical protein
MVVAATAVEGEEVVVFTAAAVVPMAAAITVEDIMAATADEEAPTEACEEYRRRDAIPTKQDLGPGRAEEVPVTPRLAGIRLDQVTVRAWAEDRPVEPSLEDRAVGPRLEDQPVEWRQTTRLLPTGSGTPLEAPAARLDRR